MKRYTFAMGLFLCITTLVLFCPELKAVTAAEGERIFFIRKHIVNGLVLGDIYSMKPAGGDVQRITSFSASSFGIQAFCAQPTWSPDGSEIVFVYTMLTTSFLGTEIQSNLYKVSVNGGDPEQLTSISGNELVSRPSFSPDGNSIAFSLLKSFGDVFLLSDVINSGGKKGSVYSPYLASSSNPKQLFKSR